MRCVARRLMLPAAIAVTLAGCSDSQPHTASKPVGVSGITDIVAQLSARSVTPRYGDGVRLRIREISTAIYNAGGRDPFVVFDTETRSLRVSPASTAEVTIAISAPSRFASAHAKSNWRLSGRPAVLQREGHRQTGVIQQFSFLPKGGLGYEAALNLPSSPAALTEAIEADTAGPSTPAGLLDTYARLLAMAPISPGTRSSLYADIASLAGTHLCGAEDRTVGVCTAANGEESAILFSLHTGKVLAIEQRLVGTSPLFPGIQSGATINSVTFLGR